MAEIKTYNEPLKWEEKRSISNLLKDYHSVFYQFWKISNPVFSNEKVNTLGVHLTKDTCLGLYINKEFWLSCTDIQKCFFICHECYHLLNCHGARINGKCSEIKNQCLDIPINEGLIKYFGFNRDDIDPEGKYCWLDTVFRDFDISPLPDESFEYYFDLLKDKLITLNAKLIFNNHDYLDNNSNDSKKVEEIIKEQIIDSIDENAKKSLDQIMKTVGVFAGSNAGFTTKIIEKTKIIKKDRWESIIKKWSLKFISSEFEYNSWLLKDRRFSLLNDCNDELLFYNDIIDDFYRLNKDKIHVVFALDTSGSCLEYADRFWKATESLDKNRFILYLYNFDTNVYKVNLKERKLYGFGGTDFKCLTKIQNEITKKSKKNNINKKLYYFVLTDGYGTHFRVDYPKNWKIFLTENGTKQFFPNEMKIYSLIDFE